MYTICCKYNLMPNFYMNCLRTDWPSKSDVCMITEFVWPEIYRLGRYTNWATCHTINVTKLCGEL